MRDKECLGEKGWTGDVERREKKGKISLPLQPTSPLSGVESHLAEYGSLIERRWATVLRSKPEKIIRKGTEIE